MGTALVGFLGVIAGAILATGTQATIAHFDRERRARTAARLLVSTVTKATAAIEAVYEGKEFTQFGFDWNEFGAAWAEHREALASALTTADFLEVSLAFTHITYLAHIRADFLGIQPPPPHDKWNFSSTAKLIEEHRALVVRARDLLFRAALTPAERRKKRLTVS